MIKLKKILIFLLLSLVIFDIFLIFLLIKGINPWQKHEFKTKLSGYTYKQGEIKILPGAIDGYKISSGTISLKGIIKSKPYYDENLHNYILPVSFVNKKEKKIILNVVLGKTNDHILLVKAKQGVISDDIINEKVYKVQEVLNLMKNNYPIIIRTFYDTKSFLTLKSKHASCKDYCKKQIDNILLYLNNTEYLLQQTPVNKELFIGPTFEVVIYEI